MIHHEPSLAAVLWGRGYHWLAGWETSAGKGKKKIVGILSVITIQLRNIAHLINRPFDRRIFFLSSDCESVRAVVVVVGWK